MTTNEHTARTLPSTRRDWFERFVSSGARPQLRPGRAPRGRSARLGLCMTLTLGLLLLLLGAHGGIAAPAAKKQRPAEAATKIASKPGARAAAKRIALMERLSRQYQLDRDVEDVDAAKMRRLLLKLVSRHDVRHFLAVIREAEAGEPNIMVGGCRAPSLKLHPALTLPRSCRYCFRMGGQRVCSSASGNFQITKTNWFKIAPFLGVRSFSETNQALVALELIRRGGGAAGATTPRGLALKHRIQRGFLHLLAGNTNFALCLATHDWASSSCSSLPAITKVVYAELSDEMKKKQAARERRARRSDDKAPPPRVRAVR